MKIAVKLFHKRFILFIRFVIASIFIEFMQWLKLIKTLIALIPFILEDYRYIEKGMSHQIPISIGDMFSWERHLEKTRSWKVLSWKI